MISGANGRDLARVAEVFADEAARLRVAAGDVAGRPAAGAAFEQVDVDCSAGLERVRERVESFADRVERAAGGFAGSAREYAEAERSAEAELRGVRW